MEGYLTVAFCEPVYNHVKLSAFKYLGWEKKLCHKTLLADF